MTEEGGTIEIKHVVKQSFTKQLQGATSKFRKANGQEAVLQIK